MSPGRAWIWCVALLLLAACAPPLPSETALGRGPSAKAGKEPPDRAGEPTASQSGEPGDGVSRGATSVDVARGAVTSSAASSAASRTKAAPAPAPAEPSGAPPAPGAGQPGTHAAGQSQRADERPIFFEGLYSGLYEVTLVMQHGQGAQKEVNPRARIRVERRSDTQAELVFLHTETGQIFATLTVQLDANTGALAAGSRWTGPPELGDLSASISTGTAKVEARRLLVDFDAQVTSRHGQPAAGKLRFHFHGWRPLS